MVSGNPVLYAFLLDHLSPLTRSLSNHLRTDHHPLSTKDHTGSSSISIKKHMQVSCQASPEVINCLIVAHGSHVFLFSSPLPSLLSGPHQQEVAERHVPERPEEGRGRRGPCEEQGLLQAHGRLQEEGRRCRQAQEGPQEEDGAQEEGRPKGEEDGAQEEEAVTKKKPATKKAATKKKTTATKKSYNQSMLLICYT